MTVWMYFGFEILQEYTEKAAKRKGKIFTIKWPETENEDHVNVDYAIKLLNAQLSCVQLIKLYLKV